MPESYTDEPILSERFERAMRLALAHHHRQLRKKTDIPYVSHLLAVTSLVLEMGGDEDEAIGALLHDMVEDGGGQPALEQITDEFGAHVALMVEQNSDTLAEPKPPWLDRKKDYIAGIATKDPGALRISLADKLHNTRAILLDFRVHRDALWERFRAGEGASVVWYYHELANAFEREHERIGAGAQPFVEELRRTVDKLRAKTGFDGTLSARGS